MSLLGRSLRLLYSGSLKGRVGVRTGYWWGHDTLEDQWARERAEREKGALISWTDPDKNIDEKKEYIWAPTRIQTEAALTLGVTNGLINVADWFAMTTKPFHWFTFFFDPVVFTEEQRKRNHHNLVLSQIFVRERLTMLGPDLAAAHFLCHRNCRVRFRGNTEWTELSPKRSLNIPAVYMKGWYIEAIDVATSELVYEGFQNLRNLQYLKHLDVSYCKKLDVWCFDRISGEYMTTLEYLDISGCTKLDWNALEVIWRFSNLKTLVMKDMEHVKDINMICLMLLDVNPNLKIIGVDYIDKTLLEGTEHEHLLQDEGAFLSIEPGEIKEKEMSQKN